jgi:ABC-type dipeptide/oligopeptide/nickel transport system permease subunit
VIGTILSPGRPAPPAAPPSRLLPARLWRDRGARTGLVLLALLAAAAALGPVLAPHDPDWPDYGRALRPPGAEHWLGTDATGRDLLSRLLDGAHRSLGAAALVLALTYAIGLVLGVAAGIAGGWVDTVLMRVVDVVMSLPGTVLAFAVVGVLGPGFTNLVLAMVVADWAYYARLARSYVLTVARQPYIAAAELAGWPRWRIVALHVLPAVAVQLAIVASLSLGGVIGAISGFSFLGLGVQPPFAEWGAMLSESRFYFPIAPWLLLGPAGLILLSVLAANLVGNGMRDALDPGRR